MPIKRSSSVANSIDVPRVRWRFVVCMSSFYINIITWGFIASTGIFEDAFKTTYRLSSFKSTLPGSIQIASMSICSVFASILITKHGVRLASILGAFISAIGSTVAAFIGHYWVFCFSYGIFVGAGQALMLISAVLAIPPYFHANCISLATASALSGASVGMLGMSYLLQYLLDTYGLRGTTLLASCLWLSNGIAGALFGGILITPNHETSDFVKHQSDNRNESKNGLIYSRRTSLLPMSIDYHQQQHENLSFIYQNNPKIERLSLNYQEKSRSSMRSSMMNVKSHTFESRNENAQNHLLDNTISKQIDSSQMKCFHKNIRSEIFSLFQINTFRIFILSLIFIWSLDETNFLFLSDLLNSSKLTEQRSTLLIAITGVFDLIGQIFFGYLGDIEHVDPFILWSLTSIIAGLTLSLAPSIVSYGITGLSIVFGIHAFFLAAPNALGNIIMIEVVGMNRYAIAYGFSLLVSGLTSLIGYPLLGFLRDKTQSWRIPFGIVGCIMIFGGLIAGTIPLCTFYKRKKKNMKTNDSISR